MKIDQIVVGFVRETERSGANGTMAEGSVTLIDDGKEKILVDVGSPDNWTEIEDGLRKRGLAVGDIDTVVITHGHLDHCANLGRFGNARIYMDNDVRSPDRVYSSTEKEISLTARISIRKFRGHTDNDLAVIVRDEEMGTVVVAGDLFEHENDENDWRANSRYPDDHQRSRDEILEMTEIVVPGHGAMFRVKKSK
ncbi:unnamed protein product, partial [Mesorhabditis belari]|uniref:Metallo-beta-lactamase domain-containing protein n=1 Tax=Mesorhabditis belari TaxID=2138241 RepID=A0AAF3FPV1_9BILA